MHKHTIYTQALKTNIHMHIIIVYINNTHLPHKTSRESQYIKTSTHPHSTYRLCILLLIHTTLKQTQHADTYHIETPYIRTYTQSIHTYISHSTLFITHIYTHITIHACHIHIIIYACLHIHTPFTVLQLVCIFMIIL